MNSTVLTFAGLASVFVVAGAAPAADTRQTSLEAFAVMDSVLTGPRCQNCHTLTDFPRQGDDRHPHRVNVLRGDNGRGAKGLPCSTCHGRANNPSSGVPGADEDWHLAPLSMGWESLSPALRCVQLKDPQRNGGRSGAAVIDHLQTPLVKWAWSPGIDARGAARKPPRISHAEFMQAAKTWVATGSGCPD
jgi:hypothetical protein